MGIVFDTHLIFLLLANKNVIPSECNERGNLPLFN